MDIYEQKIKKEERETYLETSKLLGFTFTSLEPEEKLRRTIDAGIKNIWMVGPAGCGKSTMARNVASDKELPYLCISCGIGTSATEFIGYKYPTRETTRFSEYYSKPSIILIDELTALDPAVAQILNAALANDEIETTTGLVHRHPNCIIIATSNTFGFGCDRQYVANNQLDASTIDRFIGFTACITINHLDEVHIVNSEFRWRIPSLSQRAVVCFIEPLLYRLLYRGCITHLPPLPYLLLPKRCEPLPARVS